MLSKLEWSKLAQSHRHIEDVVGILRLRWESSDRPYLEKYLEKWIVELELQEQWENARHAAGIPDSTSLF